MKKLVNIGLLAFIALFAACNGKANTEDNNTSTEEFTDISKEDGFAEKHAEPKEISLKQKGKMISIPVEAGEDASAYQVINQSETKNYLFVIHEWWGLNNHIKSEADKWFKKLDNVNVMALDLYDGKVAKTRDKAQEYMSGADETRIQSIINAAIEMLPADAKIATIGWCFGGGWSLRTALQAGEKTTACVMYYGMPVKDIAQLESLNSEVLFIYGTQDEWINKSVANQFEENMKKANKEVSILSFDADHAFANPSGDHYKETAAQEANKKAFEFLKKRL